VQLESGRHAALGDVAESNELTSAPDARCAWRTDGADSLATLDEHWHVGAAQNVIGRSVAEHERQVDLAERCRETTPMRLDPVLGDSA
jgi:hypothetical protein